MLVVLYSPTHFPPPRTPFTLHPTHLLPPQPLWTMVGAGLKQNTQSARPTGSMLNPKVSWIKSTVTSIAPGSNTVVLADGQKLTYDYLVVAPGITPKWDAIEGLKDSVGKPETGVVSIYDYNHCKATADAIRDFKGGRAIFTQPSTPIKCAGAPQKIMWMFEEKMRDVGLRAKTSVELWSGNPAIFGVKKYADLLWKEQAARDVKVNLKQELVKVDAAKKVATFKNLDDGSLSQQSYDLLHVVPAMVPPAFIEQSGLAAAGGWMDVEKFTLQSTKYPNIFGMGDATNTPNSKTAAAVLSQSPVVVHNIKRAIKGEGAPGYYDGYGSCPLMVNTYRVILAEFGYGGKIQETFAPFQMGPVQERVFAVIKRTVFPFVYWELVPRGIWYGRSLVFKPDVTKKPEGAPEDIRC